MSPTLSLFLQGWYEKAQTRQLARHRIFVLTYEEFLGLFNERQLKQLEKYADDGSLWARQNDENPYALVLTWKSFKAAKAEVMDASTAQICARYKSLIDCSMNEGDEHSDESKARIAKARLGTTQTQETKAKISSSMLGVHVGRQGTPEESARKSAAQKARWDRVRAEKAAQSGGQA